MLKGMLRNIIVHIILSHQKLCYSVLIIIQIIYFVLLFNFLFRMLYLLCGLLNIEYLKILSFIRKNQTILMYKLQQNHMQDFII
jgi:hypothetical protein